MFYVAKFFFNSEEVLLEKKTEGVAALAAAAPCCTCRGLLQLLARSQRRTARTRLTLLLPAAGHLRGTLAQLSLRAVR